MRIQLVSIIAHDPKQRHVPGYVRFTKCQYEEAEDKGLTLTVWKQFLKDVIAAGGISRFWTWTTYF